MKPLNLSTRVVAALSVLFLLITCAGFLMYQSMKVSPSAAAPTSDGCFRDENGVCVNLYVKQGGPADGTTAGNPVNIAYREVSTGFTRYADCTMVNSTCLPRLGDGQLITTYEGTTTMNGQIDQAGSNRGIITESLGTGNSNGTTSAIAQQQFYVFPRVTSATNTAQTIIIDLRGNRDVLVIRAACNAGTAALTVEGCTDSTCATSPLTLDSIAAAATQVKQYNNTTVGATLALTPLAFRWVRVTEAACGVGNTSDLQMSAK